MIGRSVEQDGVFFSEEVGGGDKHCRILAAKEAGLSRRCCCFFPDGGILGRTFRFNDHFLARWQLWGDVGPAIIFR